METPDLDNWVPTTHVTTIVTKGRKLTIEINICKHPRHLYELPDGSLMPDYTQRKEMSENNAPTPDLPNTSQVSRRKRSKRSDQPDRQE